MGLTRIRAEQISDIDYKQAVRAVATSSVVLGGGAPTVVDGVNLVLNDRVLVTNQSTGSQNGLYYVATLGTGANGTWARTTDGNESGEIEAGMIVMVTEGTSYADTQWKLTTNNPITVGSTALTFVQNYSTNSIIAGTSNVVVNSNSNVTISSAGTPNVLIVTSTGANVAGTVSASGNISGSFFLGNGSQLSGIVTTVSANTLTGNTLSSNVVNSSLTSVGTLGSLSVTGNINNGGAININSTTGNYNVLNISGTALAPYGTPQTWKFFTNNTALGGNPSFILFPDSSTQTTAYPGTSSTLSLSGNITGGNLNVTGNIVDTGALSIITGSSGNISLAPNGTNVLVATTTGANIAGTLNATGNANVGNLGATNIVGTLTTASQTNITSVGTLGSLAVTANVAGGNLTTGGQVSATGNINGGNIIATNLTGTLLTAAQTNITSVGTLGSLAVTANVAGGNLTTGGQVSATGNINGGNLNATGNVSVGNLNVTGNIVDTGALSIITGSSGNVNLAPNGTNVLVATTTGANVTGTLNATGNANVGNLGATNIVGTLTTASQTNITSVGTLGSLAVTANVAGGNLTTGGQVSATGNITSGNVNTARVVASSFVSASGNVVGGNVNTAGSMSAVGNITGGNIIATNLTGTLLTAAQTNITSVGTLSSLSASGNVAGGNLLTSGLISATGNITGGNILGGANVNATTHTGTTVSVTGNITGGNILGGANVNATTHTGTTVSVTGNITGGNISAGIGSFSGNINMNSQYINNVTNPVQNQDVATKAYVDNISTTAITYHTPVAVATTTTLAVATSGTVAYVEVNGVGNGVGAKLTTTGTFLNIDSANVQTVGTRILVKNEANAAWNGIYTYANTTSIVRSTDADSYGADATDHLSINDYFFTTGGVVNEGTAFIVSAPTGTITFGTSNITFSTFSTAQVYDAGTGLTLTGTSFSVNASQTQITSVGTLGSLSVTGATTTGSLATGGTVSATGNITGGNINTAGKVFGSELTSTNSAGDEGGQVNLALAATNTTLSGGIAIDINQNRLRFYETGGTNRGAYIDLTATTASVGSNLLSSGGTPGGANTNVQFNDASTFGGNANFTYDKVTNTLTAGIISSTNNGNGTNFKVGDDAWLGDINTADTLRLSGQQNGANGYIVFGNSDATGRLGRAGTGPLTYAGAFSATGNITGGNLITAGIVSVTGNIIGNRVAIGAGTAAAPSIQFSNDVAADTGFYWISDGNIGVTTNGTLRATFLDTGLSVVGNVTGGNLSGTSIVGTLTTAAQTNITSVGTLGSLAVTGNTTSGNFVGTLNGSGANVTSISATNISSGTLAQARLANASLTVNGTAIALGGSGTVTATATNALTIGTGLGGTSYNGSTGVTITNTGVTSVVAGTNIAVSGATGAVTVSVTGTVPTATSATTAGTVTTAAQGNITSVGTLTSLGISGSITSTAATALTTTVTGTNSANLIYGNMGDNDQFRILVGATGTNAGYVEIATADDGTEPIYVRQYTGVFTSLARTATLLDGSGNTSFPGTVTASGQLSATGNITGGNVITTGSNGNITGANVVNATTISTTQIVNAGANLTGNIGNSTTYFNTVFAKATSAQYADVAENYLADSNYAIGTVLEFGGNTEITISTKSHSSAVAGTVSDKPAYIMNSGLTGEYVTTVALLGRVPCRVVGKIRKGNLLVASHVPGVATALDKAQWQPGCVFGKSLEDYDSDQEGVIEIVVGRF
jgi:hypothetical protein